jgi:hypothetical protein
LSGALKPEKQTSEQFFLGALQMREVLERVANTPEQKNQLFSKTLI